MWTARTYSFIFTAYPLASDLRRRSFNFLTGAQSYPCEFGPSSDRLRRIAVSSVPIEGPTSTNHRNLESYFYFAHYPRKHPDSELAREGAPTSFWIRGIEYDENRLIELAKLLNFFMAYADPITPRIVIHRLSPSSGSSYRSPFTRPARFPDTLRSRPIDPTF